MKAFIEHLSGVIPVGPNTEKYGDPFELSAAYSSVDGKTAVIKALVSDRKLTKEHHSAAVAALKRIGLAAAWERVKKGEQS